MAEQNEALPSLDHIKMIKDLKNELKHVQEDFERYIKMKDQEVEQLVLMLKFGLKSLPTISIFILKQSSTS